MKNKNMSLENQWLVVYEVGGEPYALCNNPGDRTPFYDDAINETKLFKSREEAEQQLEFTKNFYYLQAELVPATKYMVTVYTALVQKNTTVAVPRLHMQKTFRDKRKELSQYETTECEVADQMLMRCKSQVLAHYYEKIMEVSKLNFN